MESLSKYIDLARSNIHTNKNLLKLTEEGLSDLSKTELPHRRMENWKYTNLNKELETDYNIYSNTDSNYTFEKDDNFTNICFLNNTLIQEQSDSIDFTLTDLAVVDPTLLTSNAQQYFKEDLIDIMNKAFMNTGHIYNFSSVIDKPILIHRHYTHGHSLNNLTNLYNFEKSSETKILEKLSSEKEIFLNIASHIICETNTNIEHCFIQDTKSGSLVFQSCYGTIKKDAHYSNIIINTGAKKSRTNLALSLIEEGAVAQAHGLYALHSDQHHDTLSYIHHDAPHTESHQLYKGIMADESRGVFTGKVRVEKDSQLINANQLNKNLILSKKAQVNSRPQLEIYADDVKCSHGSTTGQLSENELFYFESRGIRKDKARQILARAFAYDVILKIKDLKIQDFCKNHLLTKNIVS